MFVEDRDDDGAVEVLVAGRPQDPEPLQSSPQLGAVLSVLLRQPVAERVVGVTELEGL
jgi:hypothetical protein